MCEIFKPADVTWMTSLWEMDTDWLETFRKRSPTGWATWENQHDSPAHHVEQMVIKELVLVQDFTLGWPNNAAPPCTPHSATQPLGTWLKLWTRANSGRANGAEVEESAFPKLFFHRLRQVISGMSLTLSGTSARYASWFFPVFSLDGWEDLKSFRRGMSW